MWFWAALNACRHLDVGGQKVCMHATVFRNLNGVSWCSTNTRLRASSVLTRVSFTPRALQGRTRFTHQVQKRREACTGVTWEMFVQVACKREDTRTIATAQGFTVRQGTSAGAVIRVSAMSGGGRRRSSDIGQRGRAREGVLRGARTTDRMCSERPMPPPR